jgi:hypothetical protein
VMSILALLMKIAKLPALFIYASKKLVVIIVLEAEQHRLLVQEHGSDLQMTIVHLYRTANVIHLYHVHRQIYASHHQVVVKINVERILLVKEIANWMMEQPESVVPQTLAMMAQILSRSV